MAYKEGIVLEVSLYGGAVFTLVYGSRQVTKDVDAVVHPSEIAGRLALSVAAELNLPTDWLNDDVRLFLAEKESKRTLDTADFGAGLRVRVPTAAYLLAMKLRACRPPLPGYPGDQDDIRFLLKRMNFKSVREVEAIHDRFFPHDALTDTAREVIEMALHSSSP